MKEFYVMTPPGTHKSHYDGAFSTAEDAIGFLKELCQSPYAPPERQSMIIVVLNQETKTINLYRDENGNTVNGNDFMF